MGHITYLQTYCDVVAKIQVNCDIRTTFATFARHSRDLKFFSRNFVTKCLSYLEFVRHLSSIDSQFCHFSREMETVKRKVKHMVLTG